MPQPWDYIAKIVSLGDSGCGKSSLTIRLCEGRFSPYHDVTIGVEFGSRIVPVGPPASHALRVNDPSTTNTDDGPPLGLPEPKPKVEKQKQKHMKLSIWDTAGQETYKSVTRSYFRAASGALLVFDITRRETFLSVTSWLNDLRQIAEDHVVVVLVGNKSDLAGSSMGTDGENRRQVRKEEADQWCKDNNVMCYVETSAKSGEGVESAFLQVAERIYQNIEAGMYDLNDRRSGVKGPKLGNNARTVNLGLNDRDGGKGAGNGCC
ncbi:GTP-binding protein-like protein RAB2 [Eremomyces bilateralis CBS 781.70]|uniref:GTP-binding protein-like protein RAB2 n=1 Tax=Eremomyces bilateralis CBS 781.70 TaxID=1392243 RepID=A0A6G1FYM0_9PEZI|nr:GTP-binding protein-like protein RAB2 [Eremomyces bilateralis CBS 781.70]KAF1810965.1 GTP-binding protein-like protein RAB2 [Eremomyces bilateralis CBS 781.70]